MRLYTRIRIRQTWNWAPLLFLRGVALGAGLAYALFRVLLWLTHR